MNRTLCSSIIVAVLIAAPASISESAPTDQTDPGQLERVIDTVDPTRTKPRSSGFSDATVKLAVLPNYPQGALRRKIDGTVTLAFDITKHGRAANIEVVEELPRGVFGAESGDALKYWAFSPARLAACGTAEQKGRQTIAFDHDGDPQIHLTPLVVEDIPQPPRPLEESTLKEFASRQGGSTWSDLERSPVEVVTIRRVEPDYPPKALERRREGMVALSFLIETDGSVSNIEVVDTVAGYLFKREAMRAIRQWEFEPPLRDGKPVEYVACHEFVFHLHEYERSGKLARQRERENVRAFSID